MNTLTRPRSLADYAEDWWGWVKRLAPVVIVSGILGFLLPALLSWKVVDSMRVIFDDWVGWAEKAESADLEYLWDALKEFLGIFGQLVLAILLSQLGLLYSSLTIQKRMQDLGLGEDKPLAHTLISVFPSIFLRALIVVILSGVILTLALFALSLCLGILGMIVGALLFTLGLQNLILFLGFVAYLIFVAALVAISHFISLALPAVVDGKKPWDSLQVSLQLVKAHFWRLLGLRLVSGMVFSILLGLIVFLPSFLIFAPYTQELMSLGNAQSPEALQLFQKFFHQVFYQLLVLGSLSYLASLFFTPIIEMLFYHDLKARLETGKPTSEGEDVVSGL